MAEKNEKKGTDGAPGVPPQPKPASIPAKPPISDSAKIETQIATLQEGLGKIESSITKAVTASSTGFEENLKGLMQKLDDVVIAMQSSQSDKNSPFNSSSFVQELPESVGLSADNQKQQQQQSEKSSTDRNAKSADHDEESRSHEYSNSARDSTMDTLQRQQKGDGRPYREEEEQIREMLRSNTTMRLPLVSTRLQEFVKSCALLEIVEGDQKRLNYLYDIGVLRTEDLEIASRVVDLLGRFSPNLKPVDLAVIACSIEQTAASDRETRKLLAIATALNKAR